METYPSFSTMVDTAYVMEMGEKDDDSEFKRKRKQGFEGRPSGHGGSSGTFKPPSRGQTTSMVPAASIQSPVNLPH